METKHKTTPAVRWALATLVVEHMMEEQHRLYPAYPNLLRIDWEDCDKDSRKFWVTFKRPGLTNVRQVGTPVIRECHTRMRELKRLARKMLKESNCSNTWKADVRVPRMQWRKNDGKEYAEGYDTDTWVHVLSFND